MGAEIIQLRFVDLSRGALEWQRDLRVAHVEGVKKWLMMDERGVIDVERDFADEGERVFAILVIEDAHVLGDQAAERIERQPADGRFDAALVQFFDDAVTPLPAKALLGQIQSTPWQGRDGKNSQQTQCAHKNAARQRQLPILRASRSLGLFENGRHGVRIKR